LSYISNANKFFLIKNKKRLDLYSKSVVYSYMRNKGNTMNTKYYKLQKPYWGSKNLIVKESVVVVEEIPRKHKGTGRPLESYYNISIQGATPVKPNLMKYQRLYNNISDSGCLVEIPKPSDEILFNYVIPTENYKKSIEFISELKSEFPQHKNVFDTLYKWAFQTKGSSAVKLKDEKDFQKNREVEVAKFINGMYAKKGSTNKNRGMRTTPISNEKVWRVDETTLAPNGIKKGDSAPFDECVKIFNKLLTEIVSMDDTPKDLVDFLLLNGYDKQDCHLDYYYFNRISWKFFEQNTHHGKEKGLEFCHQAPQGVELPTRVENVTIGTGESNRHQGGYDIDYTLKKNLVWEIVTNSGKEGLEKNKYSLYLNKLSVKELCGIRYKMEN